MGRKQIVNLNGYFSEQHCIEYGGPQGSILGPLFFILFVNDLSLHQFKSLICIYADDTVFYHRYLDVNNVINGMQEDLAKYSSWCKYNKLPLNVGKTKALIFDNKKKNTTRVKNLEINGKPLDYVTQFKYLGMTLDYRLNFRLHFNQLMQKLGNKMHFFCKLRNMLNTYTALTVYKSHLLAFLEYGSVFMDCLPQNMKNKFQRSQNKCLRIAQKADRYISNMELHKSSKILPLRNRRKSSLCSIMYKRIGQYPELIMERMAETFKRSIAYQGPVVWNTLPLHIKSSNNYVNF